MTWKSFVLRGRALFERRTLEREMDDELRFHVEMEAERNERLGMSPAEARRSAILAFGGMERHRESMRDGRGVSVLDDVVRDLRYAGRTLLRNPGFTSAAVLTLALAIGMNGAMFSAINAIAFRPFPVHAPNRLAALWGFDPRDGGAQHLSFEDYIEWRDRSKLFEGLAAQATGPLSLSWEARTEVVWSELVTGNFFSVLGMKPVVGRFFLNGEETRRGASSFIVLSYDLWQSRFHGDYNVVGQVVRINRAPFEVVGVAPRTFHGLRRFGFWPDVWVPLGAAGSEGFLQGHGKGSLMLVGRLRSGLSVERANTEAAVFARSLSAAFPASNRDLGALLTSASTPFDSPRWVPPRVLALSAMLGLVGISLILLIACANVANLMLARASARRREMAIRLSIGGGRRRLIRQLLTESAVLSLLGGALGLPLAMLIGRLQSSLIPKLPFRVGLITSIDVRVLLFTALTAFAAVFLFGLAPALHATRIDLASALRNDASAARTRRRWTDLRQVLVAGQIALSLVLLVAGTLFTRSLRVARAVDIGVETENRVLISANPEVHGYDDARAQRYYDEAARHVRELPNVISAVWAFPVPFDTNGDGVALYIPGASDALQQQASSINMSAVDPGYFATIGTRLLSGREFTLADSAGAPRALIVSRSTAARLWPGREAIGQHARLGGPEGPELTVVGVVADAIYASPTQQHQPYVFLPTRQRDTYGLTLIVHTRTMTKALLSDVSETLRIVDPEVATYGAITMPRSADNALNVQDSAAKTAAALALLALLLALVGLYGVVAYTVELRTREVGIRMALGARPGEVIRLMLGQTTRTTLVGVAIGLVLAAGVGQAIASLLYGVSALDPFTFVVIPLALTGVAAAAAFLPARRATRVHPSVALRIE